MDLKTADKIVDSLWENRFAIKEEDFFFERPAYEPLDRTLLTHLNTDVKDAIQDHVDEYVYFYNGNLSKKSFRKKLLSKLAGYECIDF
jgi:hypothetical protein